MFLKLPSCKYYISLLLRSHWPELGHMTTPSCKGIWKIWYFYFDWLDDKLEIEALKKKSEVLSLKRFN